MKLKIKLMKMVVKYFPRLIPSPYFYTKILQMEGISIGNHTIIYDPNSQTIDRERPWMLKIGDYCKITKGCTILTHDYSRSVMRMVDGQIIGEAGITTIGNNVFIGMHSTILMGCNIGDNVIIGAGSVVSGKIPSNVVVAGNPAKVVRTLEKHIEIRKSKSRKEAFLYYNSFCEAYGRKPQISEMGPFFPLFLERTKQAITNNNVNIIANGDDTEDILNKFLRSKPIYSSYQNFQKEAELNK